MATLSGFDPDAFVSFSVGTALCVVLQTNHVLSHIQAIRTAATEMVLYPSSGGGGGTVTATFTLEQAFGYPI